MVPKTNAVPLGGRKKKIERLVERSGEEAFSEIRPAPDPSCASRPWEWACVELVSDREKGMRRWLLVRRSTDDPEDLGFYQAYGPEGTTAEELVRVCQERWAVEECFAEAKGEVGLDHYEVRKWGSWHRHVTLCLLATPSWPWCALPRNKRKGRLKGDLDLGLIPTTVPEAVGSRDGRTEEAKTLPFGMVRVEAGSPSGCAARCRAARRSQRHAPAGEGPPEIAAVAAEEAYFTNEQWELVRPLLPAQSGAVGRPPLDHRRVLGGILWVARTGSSWREMPEKYCKWETAYRRHELWIKQGLWQRVLRALGEEDLPGPATKEPN